VLVEGVGDGVSVGRTYRDAPEIDGMVFVPGELPIGEIVPVYVDGAMVYDLTGVPANYEPGKNRIAIENVLTTR
jgi:ribosomal protein S12 methylthiotransferase